MKTPDPPRESPGTERALGLDALRGLAILLMSLSSTIPWGVLPRWMYHAQVPPPHHRFDSSIPGITWVDLVFPFFLFAMGAAIPFALSRRIERGAPKTRIVAGIFARGILIAAFGVYIQHIQPTVLSKTPTPAVWARSILGFVLLFPILTRLPREWSLRLRAGVRAGGCLAAAVFLASLRYPDGTGFRLARNDIIIIVLAGMSILGSLIWMATPGRHAARLGLLAVFAALRLAEAEPGWVREFSRRIAIPHFFQLHFTKYLFLVLPGTVAGDALMQWMRRRPPAAARRLAAREGVLAFLGFALCVVCLVGLMARWVFAVFLVSAALCGIAVLLTRPRKAAAPKAGGAPPESAASAASGDAEPLRSLVLLGSAWLLLGLVLEPFEGGIRKDHATLSYPFVTGGLAVFILVALTIIVDVRRRSRGFGLLIAAGQNPLLAYAAGPALLRPLLRLTRIGPALEALTLPWGPWAGAARGFLTTLVLAVIVAAFTRRRIVWRA